MGLDTMVTATDAARLAGVSRPTIYRWRELGHLVPIAGRYLARQVLEVESLMRNSKFSRRPAIRAE